MCRRCLGESPNGVNYEWKKEFEKNPMRYAGGLLGGIWLISLLSDLGHGKFDGAWLEENFESLNPGNTLISVFLW